MTVESVFRFVVAQEAAGRRTALVTVTAVAGGSTRDPGAHMAVSEDGATAGSLSGGCIEAAVAAEALAAIATGALRQVRFGGDSPFRDIRLPCGGAIDLLINPLAEGIAGEAVALFDARAPFVLSLPADSRHVAIERGEPGWRTERRADGFAVAHVPPLRLAIVGHGEAVDALVALAAPMGAASRVWTPDRHLAERLRTMDVPVTMLTMPGTPAALELDAWTAVVFLFHEHEWETTLVAQALLSDAFYVGAMGGRITAERRREALLKDAVPETIVARLQAPIGLFPAARDPRTLALSTLAQVVRARHATLSRPHKKLSGAG